MVGHRTGGWDETGYLCLVQRLLFKECYNRNDSTFMKFVFEFVNKPSFSITA